MDKYTFEELFRFVKPSIVYFAKRHPNTVKSYEFDDLFQELSIKLWNIYEHKKIPQDMGLDRRMVLFLNKVFARQVIDLSRKEIVVYRLRKYGTVTYKDGLTNSLPHLGEENTDTS